MRIVRRDVRCSWRGSRARGRHRAPPHAEAAAGRTRAAGAARAAASRHGGGHGARPQPPEPARGRASQALLAGRPEPLLRPRRQRRPEGDHGPPGRDDERGRAGSARAPSTPCARRSPTRGWRWPGPWPRHPTAASRTRASPTACTSPGSAGAGRPRPDPATAPPPGSPCRGSPAASSSCGAPPSPGSAAWTAACASTTRTWSGTSAAGGGYRCALVATEVIHVGGSSTPPEGRFLIEGLRGGYALTRRGAPPAVRSPTGGGSPPSPSGGRGSRATMCPARAGAR
jgi:hypothetical protein